MCRGEVGERRGRRRRRPPSPQSTPPLNAPGVDSKCFVSGVGCLGVECWCLVFGVRGKEVRHHKVPPLRMLLEEGSAFKRRYKATWKREFKVPWRKAGILISGLGPVLCQYRSLSLDSKPLRSPPCG
jgi:hypothetical protein